MQNNVCVDFKYSRLTSFKRLHFLLNSVQMIPMIFLTSCIEFVWIFLNVVLQFFVCNWEMEKNCKHCRQSCIHKVRKVELRAKQLKPKILWMTEDLWMDGGLSIICLSPRDPVSFIEVVVWHIFERWIWQERAGLVKLSGWEFLTAF